MRALFAIDPAAQKSFLYFVDVRTKLLVTLCLSVLVVYCSQIQSLGVLVLFSTVSVLSVRRYKLLSIIYGFLALMWVIALGWVYLMSLVIPDHAPTTFETLLIPFMRSTVSINMMLALAFSSRVHNVLTSLKSFHLPIWIFMPAAVMIRFIPTFLEDIKQINETIKIRGHALTPWFIICNPLLSTRLIVAPSVFRALRSAGDLGVAAELKGINGKTKSTNYKLTTFSKYDGAVFVVSILMMIACVMVNLSYVPMAYGDGA